MSELDSAVKEFLVESHENLDQLDRDLVVLEQCPHDRERLASVFRTVHTIKGTCGFFAFTRLQAVAHVGENLLCKLRDGELTLDAERTTALLGLVDALRAMLASIEQTGRDGDEDYGDLVATLSRLQARGAGPADAPSPHSAAPAGAPVPGTHHASVDAPPPPPGDVDHGRGVVSDSTIRVGVGLLDRLMNLVGELVLTRNQVLQYTATQKDPGFAGTTQRLNLITTELQEGVMKTRMQPIGNVWNRFPRVVRDLAAQCGKQVRVEMEGQETELDKTIIEAIKDPLTHVVRNSVDHGIEAPDVRQACGKAAEGRLTLRAYHEGGQVNIEIADDGRGIDHERVIAKAVEKGLLARDQAGRMTDREAVQLIFLPGFSTAAAVTNVSGRGVGMDVVKTNIEKIGGAVEVLSRPGQGTTLKIKIPLTLAIIPALIVTAGGDRFAIPQASLLKLVRLDGEAARRGIERLHGVPVYRLRGRLLPLLFLDRELALDRTAGADRATNIVVLQADDRQFGLVVDEINDTEEIVVKPLGKLLKGIPVFAGATILGDGQVALILDVVGLAHRGRVLSAARDRVGAEVNGPASAGEPSLQTLLLLEAGGRRLALPLALVARLEEIAAGAVEWADGQEVVQYRGDLLPLIRLADLLGCASAPGADRLPVVVFAERGHSVGLVVDRIHDILETRVDVKRGGRCPAVLGTAVIQGKVTDLLDVPGVIRSAAPEFFGELVGA